MDNPQPKVSDVEYGWVAGFFDGEGSIALAIRPVGGKNNSPKIYPLASMVNTNRVALDALTDILTRVGIGHFVEWMQPKGFAKSGRQYKKAWVVRLSGFKRCKKFFQWITPALHEKKQRAEVMLDYIQMRESHTDFRTPITEEELQLALYLKYLNTKGKGQPYQQVLKLNTERPGASHEKLSANGRKGAEARWGNRY